MAALHRGQPAWPVPLLPSRFARHSHSPPWPYGAAYVVAKRAAIRLSENLVAETQAHGISVFSIHPGLVRTAMTEAVAESRDDAKWLGGMFHKLLSAGRDVPSKRTAQLVAFLASGRADALSGHFISVRDDVAEMVQRTGEIREGELYTLRLRT